MQLLYRINRTGTTVLVATHDREMVDKMRRRVLALDEGRLVRDEATAGYHDESTSEFAVRVRAEMGVGTRATRTASPSAHASSRYGLGSPRGSGLLLHRRGVPGAAPQRGAEPGGDRHGRAHDAPARRVRAGDQGELDHERERPSTARAPRLPQAGRDQEAGTRRAEEDRRDPARRAHANTSRRAQGSRSCARRSATVRSARASAS